MALNVNASILDANMKHALVVEMFNRDLNNRVQKILRRSDRAVQTLIRNGDLSAADDIVRAVNIRINQAYDDVYRVYAKDLRRFASNEVDFQSNVLDRRVGKALKLKRPSKLDIRKAVITNPVQIGGVGSKKLAGHLRGLAGAEIKQVRAGVSQALARGLSSNDAADFIFNNPEFVSPNKITRNQLRALVRTSITDTQSFAALETFRANSGIIQRYKYIATLDQRTSSICAGLDGNIYGVEDSDAKRPPQHYNCRSAIVPIVKGYEDIGNRLKKRGVPSATRASINGQIPATTDFGSWLRTQSHVVQNTVLGIARAEEFRTGVTPLKQIIGRDGQSLSIGAARTIDARIADFENPRILVRDGTKVDQFNINDDVSTKSRFINKSNRDSIVRYVSAQAGSGGKRRSFGRINEKSQKGRGGDFIDEETGVLYVDDRISYDPRAYKQILDDEKIALKAGAISRRDIAYLDDMERRLRPHLDSNQITAARLALRNVIVRFNGKKGSGRGYVDIERLILDNPNAFIKDQLDLASGKVLGRLSRRRRIAKNKTSIKDLYGKVKTRRRDLRRTEATIDKSSQSNVVVETLEEVLRDLDILPVRGLSRLSRDLLRVARSSLSRGATPTALELGKLVGAREGTRIATGYRILETLSETTNDFRIVTRERNLRSSTVTDRTKNPGNGAEVDNNNKKSQEYREIQPTSDAWIVYQRNLIDESTYQSLPQTVGKGNAILKAGDTIGPDGKTYIKNKAGNDRNNSLSKTDAESTMIQNQQQYRVNQKVVTAYKVYRDEFPGDLGEQYTKFGEVTHDWDRLIDTYEYWGTKNFVFYNHPDYRHRKYSRGTIVDPQGNEWNRGALRFGKQKTIDADFELRFDSEFAQNLGP